MTTSAQRTRVRSHFKDEALVRLADLANVAQFVSFAPGVDPSFRHARIFGRTDSPHEVEEAVGLLIETSIEHSVNVRSFLPEQPKSHDFIYGLKKVGDAAAAVRRLAAEGLYTIVNETIDVNDGGVSGVSSSDIIEFAPGDTPRCVEKPGTAAFARDLGLDLLEVVYGFRPELPASPDLRIEFSLHPLKRGYRNGHTIIWEEEEVEPLRLSAATVWPNHFSRLIGDKTFGLLVAHIFGAPVPRTTAIPRRLPPFTFGLATGTDEHWIRTAPIEQVPGRFMTNHGWLDPFALLASEDPDGHIVASVLSQEGVDASYSGAAVKTLNGELIVEGVAGHGDDFMQGRMRPQPLPPPVVEEVSRAHGVLSQQLGSVRFEWVYDGERAWIVQLHRGAAASEGNTIYPGTPEIEHTFSVADGLEALRGLIDRLEPPKEGIVLVGEVGVTSHLGDVLRRARVPSRIAARASG
jgi:hypothetical protein